MARQRNYRQEYQRRKERAVEKGYSGYSQQRRSQDLEITRIMESDPIFTALPDDLQTRQNALLYRQGFYYVGKPTKQQADARKKLLKISGGALDVNTWAEFYKDIIYPAKTGKDFPGFVSISRTDVESLTPEEFDRLMGD